MNSRAGIGALLGASLALVAGAVLVLPQLEDEQQPDPRPLEVVAAQSVQPGAVLKSADACAGGARKPFGPTSIRVQDVTKDSRVLALPRDSHNVPGVPATSDKTSFAWDAPGIKPGSPHGNVLLNAHTWPDGTAMGNALLRGLDKGEVIELRRGKVHLCYQVTERLETPVEHPPLQRVYDFTGKPQAVLIVCSGVRRGPGDWSHRTIWFARPISS